MQGQSHGGGHTGFLDAFRVHLAQRTVVTCDNYTVLFFNLVKADLSVACGFSPAAAAVLAKAGGQAQLPVGSRLLVPGDRR